MRALADAIDAFNKTVGKGVAWLALAMVLVQFAVVLARYVFGYGNLWAQESVTYMHGFLFMLAAAYTLAEDGHVRVDIFYRSAGPRFKAAVNLFGALFLLIPVAVLIVVISWGYVAGSWRILEGSRESSGIPGVFLLKTAIPAFGVMIALQGLVMVIRSTLALADDPAELDRLTERPLIEEVERV
jgi:TRAP-type mannitol/chloroaromatic compound transport system permease small subunit